MTRNQLLPNNAEDLSGSVMFTVDGHGNITPTARQTVNGGETILTQADSACQKTFSGQVCARQKNVCQCSALVGVASGDHMTIGIDYRISSSVPVDSEFELYAVTGETPVASATTGDIRIGSGG